MKDPVDTHPLVSVCLIVFNHAKYIEGSLKSILSQKTSFPYELIIHDDASTDESVKIIKKILHGRTENIKLIFQKINQYSQGIGPDGIAMKEARGEFIAYCDGDDFWSNTGKLQYQVDRLREYKDCNLCFHSSNVLNESNLYGFYGDKEKIIQCEDIIAKGGVAMPMASILIRREVVSSIISKSNDFYSHNMSHFMYQFFGSYGGGALYLPKIMSTYRRFSEGSWSSKMKENPTSQVAIVEYFIDSIQKADRMTEYTYTQFFAPIIRLRINSILRRDSISVDRREVFYKKVSGLLKVKSKLEWFFIFKWPFLHKLVFFLFKKRR